jgi:hypothetical protein
MLRVFLSSTYVDLVEHRRKVAASLAKAGHGVIGMEDFAASDQRPLARCLAEVERCDVCIGIVAWKLGFQPTEGNPQRRSITELEIRHAQDLDKTCLIFLLQEGVTWLPEHFDLGNPPRPIDQFRETLKREFTVDYFTSPDDLAAKVLAAIRKWEEEKSPQEASATERSEFPVRPMPETLAARLPGLFAALTLGLWNYRQAEQFRQKLLRLFLSDGLESAVVGPDFRIPFQERAEQAERGRITVVSGPAGVGKTTYVSKMLRDLESTVDVVILLRGGRLTGATAAAAHLAIEKEILRFFSETLMLEEGRRLSPAGVAYALRWKRVLFVLEDLHQAGAARDVLHRLREYLEHRRCWGEHITLIATTREPQEALVSQLGTGATVIPLRPLAQEQAQRFFFELCRENGLEPARLVEHGDKIAKAFPTEAVRTPLFIVICAWLASPLSRYLDLGRVLEMSASEVFDTFILHLFLRSGEPEEAHRRFRDVYEGLALALWPDWEDCRRDRVEDHLAKLDPAGRYSLRFLEGNGFLFRPGYQILRTFFPHHTMADYLAASAMARHRDFSKLPSALPGRVDGLIPFLAELADSEDLLERIAQEDMLLFLRVVEQRSRRGDRQLPVRKIISQMALWACQQRDDKESPELWVRIRDLLEERVGAWWIESLCEEVRQAGIVAPRGIAALAALDRPQTHDLLCAVLKEPGSEERFRPACESLEVQRFLLSVVKGQSEESLGRRAFRFLWSLKRLQVQDELERWTSEHVARLEKSDVQALCEHRGAAGAGLLGRALKDSSMALRRSISSLVEEALGRVLIPCGTYEVSIEDGQTRKVRVSHPFLVPPLNEPLPGRFNSMEALKTGLERRQGGKIQIMTRLQACIALNYFPHQGSRRGVLFNPPDDATPEVFWNEEGRLGLYVIPNTRTAALQPVSAAPPGEGGVLTKVTFRPVERV